MQGTGLGLGPQGLFRREIMSPITGFAPSVSGRWGGRRRGPMREREGRVAVCLSYGSIVGMRGKKAADPLLGSLVQPDEARGQHAQRGDAVRGRGRAAPLLGQPARGLSHSGGSASEQRIKNRWAVASCSFRLGA